jgi:hypothetical protein
MLAAAFYAHAFPFFADPMLWNVAAIAAGSLIARK